MSLIVSWRAKKFTVTFHELFIRYQAEWSQHVLISDLCIRLQDQTNVPYKQIKLVHGGGTLHNSVSIMDHSRTLGYYRLQDGSKILMIGDPQNSPETQVISCIDGHLSTVYDIIAELQSSEATMKRLMLTAEQLLQVLLKVDSITFDSDNVRTQRRECVKAIQTELDKIDRKKELLDKQKL